MTQGLAPSYQGYKLLHRNRKTKYFKFPNVIRAISPKVTPMIDIPWKLKTNKITQQDSQLQAYDENVPPLLSRKKRLRKYKQDIQKDKTNSSTWKLLTKAQSVLLTTQKWRIQLFPYFSILAATFPHTHPPESPFFKRGSPT